MSDKKKEITFLHQIVECFETVQFVWENEDN